MSLLTLPIVLDVERAALHFQRPRFRNLFGLIKAPLHTPGGPDARIPPFVELLWMPAYAMCLDTVKDGVRGKVWTSVDGWSGHVAFFDGIADLRDDRTLAETFPIVVSRAQAEESARKSVLQFILRQRQLKKPVVEGVKEVRVFHYPVWVCYYYRRAGRLDIQTLDAYTGRPGGSRMRMAVLNALIDAKRKKEAAQGCSQ